jgi:hypothetical protein
MAQPAQTEQSWWLPAPLRARAPWPWRRRAARRAPKIPILATHEPRGSAKASRRMVRGEEAGNRPQKRGPAPGIRSSPTREARWAPRSFPMLRGGALDLRSPEHHRRGAVPILVGTERCQPRWPEAFSLPSETARGLRNQPGRGSLHPPSTGTFQACPRWATIVLGSGKNFLPAER